MTDSLRERRGPIRVRSEQKMWCSYAGRTMGCHSRDLSDSGLRLQAPAPLPVGSVVELRPQVHTMGRRRLTGRVVWTQDDGLSGVRLEEQSFRASWAEAALRQVMGRRPYRPRRDRRLAHCLSVSLHDGEGRYRGAALTQDLSMGGMRLSCRVDLEPGAVLTASLELPGQEPLPLPCHVVSVGEGRLNLRFFRLAASTQRTLHTFLSGRKPGFLSSLWARLSS